MGLDAMTLLFWMLSIKPAFSLSSFTFIKRLFSSSLLSVIKVVSSAFQAIFFIVLVFCFKLKVFFLQVYHKEFTWSIYLWARSCHRWASLNSRRILPHSSWDQESEIKVWPGLVLSETLVCPQPLLPVSLSISFPLCSFFLCLRVVFFFVNSQIGWGAHPTQEWPHLC